MTKSVLVTGSIVSDEQLEPLRKAGFNVVEKPGNLSDQDIISMIGEYEGYLFGGNEYLNLDILKHATKMEAISLVGVDIDMFLDREYAESKGIEISNTPGVLADSGAEYCITQLLTANRRPHISRMRSIHEYKGVDPRGDQLSGTCVGIIGLGGIGSRVSKILTHGFGCDVKYYSRTRKPEIEERDGITFCEVSEMFTSVDSVVVCVTSNEKAKALFTKELFESIVDPIVLVSISSSMLFDPQVLLDAVNDGRIKALAMDHFYYSESSGAQALLDYQDRVYATRHIGSLTHTAYNAMSEMAVSNLIKDLK